MPDYLSKFSSAPLSAEERQLVRSRLEATERLLPLLRTYENGKVITRFAMIIGAWIVGATTAVLGVLNGIRAMNWWPFNGG